MRTIIGSLVILMGCGIAGAAITQMSLYNDPRGIIGILVAVSFIIGGCLIFPEKPIQDRTRVISGDPLPITDNPFRIDGFSLGTQLSEELWFMHSHFPNERFRSGYIYNIQTGEKLIILKTGKEAK